MSAISAPSIPQQLGVLSRYLGRLASTDPDQVWEASRKVREVLKGEMVPLPEQEEDEEVATVDVCEGGSFSYRSSRRSPSFQADQKTV